LREKSIEAFRKVGDTPTGAGIIDPGLVIRGIPVTVDRSEPLRKEIISFLAAVRGEATAAVTGEEGLQALGVAERVLESIAKTWSAR